MSEQEKKTIEIRGFLQLDEMFRKRNWPRPLIMEIEEPITGEDLAEKLGIPLDQIEILFVNGFTQNLDYVINPGDRMAFVPPGCPGPHRIYLGFIAKNYARKVAHQQD